LEEKNTKIIFLRTGREHLIKKQNAG
jgi:hypothetical protein